MTGTLNIETIFGQNVFTLEKMKERLPQKAYEEVTRVRTHGGQLSSATADIVARAMKDWAVEHGATHYTHWFQPLTGITAEKHDSFVTHPDEEGRMLLDFSGKELIKGEADASSFPSGGLRSTFEARGYTVWDITSPAFLKEDATGVILCVPTAFCSYKGEALDKKTPLLRSMEALSQQAMRIVRIFHPDTTATKVIPSVGAEQEYFLIDRSKYLKRKDLIFSGRTLFGAPAPKGQELEDHYFGVIRERVGAFMKDLNIELWKLGVTAKTQHNEVAPAQHELAPVYETANIAMDHNQLVMETMKKVAERHNLRCLLHEKPFAGVNGSGKHDNWSISTDTGMNLLDPGETPNENVQFLLVLACVMKAVDTHADLLRRSASNVGNDLRLGANEAPPAIVSIFLGSQLEDVVRQLVETGEARNLLEASTLHTGVSTVPDLHMDATDRNRTSPFAFTGNKFEFRMVDRIEAAGEDGREQAIHDVIKEFMTKHRRIIFNGDGYSEAWIREARRRGLPNYKSMIDSIEALTTDKAIRLYERFGIYNRAELESRKEILYETYSKTINIEALTMIDMASRDLLPAVIRYSRELAETVNAAKAAGSEAAVAAALLRDINESLIKATGALEGLKWKEKEGQLLKGDVKRQAFFYRDTVVPAMAELRAPIDRLETMVDRTFWPVPVYSDLLFEV